MTNTIELRNLIKEVLGDSQYEIFADQAEESAKYPYVVFEISRSSAEIYPFVGYIEVNVWDKYNTYSRADSIMDIVESKLRNQYFENDKVGFRAFDGDRGHLIDTDKSIKRTREKFMIRFFKKGEE